MTLNFLLKNQPFRRKPVPGKRVILPAAFMIYEKGGRGRVLRSSFLSSIFSAMKISIFKFLFSLNGARVFLGDGPLEKLWGGGEFSSRRIFFRYQIPCINFSLGHSMNIF